MSMMRHEHEQEAQEEYRYDSQTVQKVMALASRLQQEHQEKMTPAQVETLAAELGLEPAFVRKALELLAPQQAQKTTMRKRQKEFKALLAGLGLPIAWGVVAYEVLQIPRFSGNGPWGTFATLLLPTLLALIQGFMVRKKQPAYLLGMFLCLCLGPTFWEWVRPLTDEPGAWFYSFAYILFGGALAGVIGMLGAAGRDYYFPEEELPSPTAPDKDRESN